MTITEIRSSDREMLTPADIAGVLGSDPQTIRTSARIHPKHIGFPFTIIGSRMKIPRMGFLRWYEGTINNEHHF